MDFKISKGVLRKYIGSGGTVVIPDGVTEIGKHAFASCDTLTDVAFPDSVRVIQPYAFKNCTALKSVRFGAGLTGMAMWAFAGCKSLHSIRLPASMEKIGGFAFEGCTTLQEVELNDGLLEIATGAFEMCSSLEEVRIPDSVRQVEMRAFYECKTLSRVWLSEKTHLDIDVFYGCGKLFDRDGFFIVDRTLYGYDHDRAEVVVPRSVTRIGEWAFYPCRASTRCVRLHNGITYIGDNAFRNSNALEEVTIPASVETIGDRAFYMSKNLFVRIEGNPRVGKEVFEDVRMILAPQMEFAAFDCAGARAAAFWGYVKHRDCYQDAEQGEAYRKYANGQRKKLLPKVWRDDDVDVLAYFGEIGCIKVSNFEKDYMEPALAANAVQCIAYLLDWRGKYLSTAALEKQTERELLRDPYSVGLLKKQWNYEKNEDGTLTLTGYKGTETEVQIPYRIGKAAVTSLGDKLFAVSGTVFWERQRLLKHITSVELPDTVTNIGTSSFSGCLRLELVKIPASVTKIGKNAFQGCEHLNIHGQMGSYAEDYAKKNKIPFVAV